jgi:hypothetical protein
MPVPWTCGRGRSNGWSSSDLRQDDREDRNQVLLALYRFLDQTELGDPHP